MQNVIELEQLPQHDFDQGLRDKTDVTGEDFCSAYNEVITGEPLTDEHMSRFEVTLVGALNERAEARAMLQELAFHDVNPHDARMVLEKEIIPSDEILDKIAALRAKVLELVEDYQPSLEGEQLFNDAPDAKERLARFVIASCLLDDRDEREGE
ncbi:hypothetical protein pEaSNUABM11_00139 [Erwinia phage pEa_SNUABM_11]|nr:hypothetical protein pEaSNUABM11_00139 [Erwinia phage pEa_SNUABM_11]